MAKILIIDDDEALSTIYATAFKKQGFEVFVAADGQTGIRTARNEKPDMILLDQVMPDMKGTEVLRALKADPDTAHIPISLLSNFGQNEIVQDAINHGATDYILKYQIEPQDLVAKVKNIMQEAQNNPGNTNNQPTSQSEGQSNEPTNS